MQSCLDSRLQIFFPDLFSYAVIPADDIGSFNMLQYFDCATKYIHSLHKTGAERILIHCSVGRSRSVAIVLAYLIRYHGHTLNSAFLHVWCASNLPPVGFYSHWFIFLLSKRQETAGTSEHAFSQLCKAIYDVHDSAPRPGLDARLLIRTSGFFHNLRYGK